MTVPYRYDSRLSDALTRAAESYRGRDDDGTADWLEEAIVLAPWRTDIRFCLASHRIQSGVPEQAAAIYEHVLQNDPNDAEALFFAAHWQRFLGDREKSLQRLEALRSFRPDRSALLERIWSLIDKWAATAVTDSLPLLPKNPERPAVVLLGYQLNPDGTARPTLIARLEKALAILLRYPHASIIVSGGVPRGGRVEAAVMREWLEARGVESSRIIEEGCSRDIVENLVYSRQILAGMNADAVLGVTCAVNVRRTGAGLELLAREYGAQWAATSTACSGATFENFADDGRDRLKNYRDILRVSGIPMMASYPYLAER